MMPWYRRLAGRFNRWIRGRLFREEPWAVEGPARAEAFDEAVLATVDRGRPFLLSLPRLSIRQPFVGRIVDRQIDLKRRTHPALWLISPGPYYFSGAISTGANGGVSVQGGYRLRPVLVIVYYVYFTIGAGILLISALSTLLGLGLWAALSGMDASVVLIGLEMLGVSGLYCTIGFLHIALEKWLDRNNRRAVRALLVQAAGST